MIGPDAPKPDPEIVIAESSLIFPVTSETAGIAFVFSTKPKFPRNNNTNKNINFIYNIKK